MDRKLTELLKIIADKGVVVKQHTVLTGTEEVQVVVDKGKTV